MKIEAATPTDADAKLRPVQDVSRTRHVIPLLRPWLVIFMYLILFLPWMDRRATDLYVTCPPDCTPVNGWLWWLSWAGWTAFVCGIPLLTLLPTALAVTRWPKQPPLFVFYYASLFTWLLTMIAFALWNATAFTPGATIYVTPYIGLALAAIATILEVIYIIVIWRERKLTRA